MDLRCKREERIGEINYNRFGTKMKIIDYVRKDNITVEFQDEYKVQTKTTYQNFKNGIVKNPYDKIAFGIGYIGEGKYHMSYDRKMYNTWYGMFIRCYDPYNLNYKYSTYINCTVDKQFFCLQDFGKWYEENYYEIPNEIMCLDKDIIKPGNHVYGPDTCIIVPQTINSLVSINYKNNTTYPGVCYHKNHGKFMASCSVYENNKKSIVTLGYFDNPEDAFIVYKKFKEKYIKIVAERYKNTIPEKLYNALQEYEIVVTDYKKGGII